MKHNRKTIYYRRQSNMHSSNQFVGCLLLLSRRGFLRQILVTCFLRRDSYYIGGIKHQRFMYFSFMYFLLIHIAYK